MLSPVAGRLGRPRSPCAAPERETEALEGWRVVVGSLARRGSGWGRGRPHYAAHVGLRRRAGCACAPSAAAAFPEDGAGAEPGRDRDRGRCPRSVGPSAPSSPPAFCVITQRRGRCGVRSRRLRLRRLPSAGGVPSERPRDGPRRRRGWRRRSSERPLWPALPAVRKQSGCLW